jgi:tRNA pseudouridine55 synthase
MKPRIYPIASDVYLTNKPTGPSSFGWISRIKRSHGFKKIGHAGTLDPFASGLLILGINNGTKSLQNYVGLDKEYRTTIIIGETTDTLDPKGIVTKQHPIHHDEYIVLKQRIIELWPALVGTHSLVVPSFSAKKVAGQTLYKLARAGKQTPTIHHDATVLNTTLHTIYHANHYLYIDATFHVTSGTYIRSLAQHIGNQLALPARVETLDRTKIGTYSITRPLLSRLINFVERRVRNICHYLQTK